MLSVVIPTYNESKNIRKLVAQIDIALQGVEYEIVFVDDSKDDTPDVINEVAKDYPQVRMEHRKNGTGLATAVLDGFKLAKGEYMACMDADLQHPPIVLKYMYKAMLSGADFCIPSRLIPGGDDGGLNWYRKFVSGTARKIDRLCFHALERYLIQQVVCLCSDVKLLRMQIFSQSDGRLWLKFLPWEHTARLLRFLISSSREQRANLSFQVRLHLSILSS